MGRIVASLGGDNIVAVCAHDVGNRDRRTGFRMAGDTVFDLYGRNICLKLFGGKRDQFSA